MATLEQIAEGIRRADAAGDADAVRILGAEYRKLQGGSSSAPQSLASPSVGAALPEREGLLPQFLSGVTEGGAALLGLPNTIEMGLRSIGPALVNMAGGEAAYPQDSWLPDAGSSFRNFANEIGAISAPSEDLGGRIVRRVGEEVGASMIPVAAPLSRARNAAQAAQIVGREAAVVGGAGVGAGVASEIAPDNAGAEIAGQLLGGLTGGTLSGSLRRAVTPNPISDERLSVARALQREGIELTGGQVSGSKNLRNVESELGGSTAQDFSERQAEQFTKAALSRAGINSSRATPDVINDAFKRVGSEFDRLSEKTLIPLDEQLGVDIGTAWRNYADVVPESQQASLAKNMLADLSDMARGHGTLPGPGTVNTPYLSGEAYKAYRSRLSRAAQSSRDPELKMFLEDIMKGLDDSAERYLGQNSPDDLDAWRQARRDYRNLLTIEKAASGAGEGTASGLLSPQRLRQAVVGNDRRGYVRGYNDFSELTHAGNEIMTPLPDSGTAGRMSARNLMTAPSAIAGALLGNASGDAMMGIAGGVAGAAVPGAVGRALLSRPGRAYTSNQLLRPIEMEGSHSASAIARALALM